MTDQFEIQKSSESQRLPYTFKSIMHFKAAEYSKDENFTIIPRLPDIDPHILGLSEMPSLMDYMHINLLYCDGRKFVSINVTITFTCVC